MSAIRVFDGEHHWLSNFHSVRVWFDGDAYPSVEHAYQAAKTIDKDERAFVRRAPTAGAAKRYGRSVTMRADWETIKLDVMLELVRRKFATPYLRARLLETGSVELVEGNHWGDRFWGVCKGAGENHLGRILMQVREELRRTDDLAELLS